MKTLRLVRVVLAGLLGGLAGLGFGPVFGGVPGPGAFVTAIAATAGAATLVVAVAALLPKLSPTLVTLLGAALVAGAAIGVTGSGTSIADGPWRLLTSALPADPTGPPMGIVALAAGWSALLAGLLAAYGANALAPVLPPLACLLVALGLGASGPPLPGWYAPACVALLLALLLAGRGVPPRLGVLVTASVTLALAVAAAVLLGPALPGAGAHAPADARALVDAPVLPRSGVSPLQQYLALRDDSLPVRVTGTSSRPGVPLRMATLTHFDGTYWTVSGDFRRAGKRLPKAPTEGRPTTVTARVRVESGDPDWLLSPGRATRVTVGEMGVDEATGDVAVPAGKASPTAYDTTSVLNEVGVDAVLSADPARAEDRLTPPLPASIRGFVERTVAGQASASDQLVALYQELKSRGGFHYDRAKDVAGGHGYYQIQRLLASKRGTSEQYASAYAVMARHLGVDARVVMGFRPEYQGNAFVATGRNVDAWVEVRFAGLGWVPIDPSPRANPIGTRPDQPKSTSRSAQVDDPLKNTPAQRGGESRSAPKGQGEIPTAPADRGRTLSVALLVAALLAVLVLAVPGAKATRRARRRRDRSPRRAVLGAWWETVDRLREAGLPVGPTLTTGEVVRLTNGLPEVSGLATMVDRAAYAPHETGADLPERAWLAARHVRRRVWSGMPVRRRFVAFLDPRPLFPSRRD
jgi:transglutaminase-like putative cysteine protease